MGEDEINGIPEHGQCRANSRGAIVAVYLLAMVVTVSGRAFLDYFRQEYRSPSYRDSLVECYQYAATSAAGPIVVVVYSTAKRAAGEWIGVAALMCCVVSLFVFAAVTCLAAFTGLSRLSLGWHAAIAIIWLSTGTLIWNLLMAFSK